jgi:hypothetical protein
MGWMWVILIAFWLMLNVLASVRVISDDETSPVRRIAQLALVWLVPIVGAIIYLVFRASDILADRPSLSRTAFANNADASGEQAITHVDGQETYAGDGGGDGRMLELSTTDWRDQRGGHSAA